MSQTEPIFTLGDEVAPEPIDPPQEGAGDAGAPPPPPQRKGRPTQLDTIEDEVSNVITMLGMAVIPFDEYDATCIIEGASPMATAIRHLCEKNSKVKARILAMLEAGAYGEVVIASSMIVLPILMHHGILPNNLPSGGYERATAEQNGHHE